MLQPVAHALLQARADVSALAPRVPVNVLWAQKGAASAGFHLIHMVNVLDRLFTYARGESLSEEQKATLREESEPQPHVDGAILTALVDDAIDLAIDRLAATDPATLLDERKIGRAGLPSNVLGLLFHAAEHTTRHVGQFITTVKLLG